MKVAKKRASRRSKMDNNCSNSNIRIDVKIERASDDESVECEIELCTDNGSDRDAVAGPSTAPDVSRKGPGKPRASSIKETDKTPQDPKAANQNSKASTENGVPNLRRSERNRIPRIMKPVPKIRRVRASLKKRKYTKYVCEDCGRCFRTEYLYKQHIKCHEVIKHNLYFKCKECKYQAATQDSMDRHKKLHDKKRQFVCDVCDLRYVNGSNLNDHVKNVHFNKKNFSCEHCDYRTNEHSVLRKHARIHTDEKPFRCTRCPYRCNLKTDLVKHMRTHTGEKPYSCSICELKCATKSNLNKHLRVHTGERPFACHVCAYRCARKENYLSHLGTHL